MDRSGTYDFLLTFHSNHRLILYRFQYIARHWPKTAYFWTHVYFTPPLSGSLAVV